MSPTLKTSVINFFFGIIHFKFAAYKNSSVLFFLSSIILNLTSKSFKLVISAVFHFNVGSSLNLFNLFFQFLSLILFAITPLHPCLRS